jgi:type IV secretory pathway VirB2 component (pilin)
LSSVSASQGRSSGTKILAVVAGIVAVLAAIVGIIYFMKTSESLPGFLPGRRAHNAGHDTVKGIAAIVVAVALFVVAGVAMMRGGKTKAGTSA